MKRTKKVKNAYRQTSWLEKPERVGRWRLSLTSSTRPQLEEAVLNGLFP
jgi:hypothetical protein